MVAVLGRELGEAWYATGSAVAGFQVEGLDVKRGNKLCVGLGGFGSDAFKVRFGGWVECTKRKGNHGEEVMLELTARF